MFPKPDQDKTNKNKYRPISLRHVDVKIQRKLLSNSAFILYV